MKTLIQLTDDVLVKLYEEGNNAAFEVLLTRYKSKVYSYIYQVVHDRDLAEDIFQDTFIKAITTIQQGKYHDSGKFLGWINRIAHNLIIDNFRKEKNENTFSSDAVDYDITNNAKLSDLSYEDIMSNEKVYTDAVKLIDSLPVVQQEIVRMRIFEDLSFKEIADKLDISINTALGRMRYAIINLRKIAKDKKFEVELK